MFLRHWGKMDVSLKTPQNDHYWGKAASRSSSIVFICSVNSGWNGAQTAGRGKVSQSHLPDIAGEEGGEVRRDQKKRGRWGRMRSSVGERERKKKDEEKVEVGGRRGHLQPDPEGPGRLANDPRCSVSSGRRGEDANPSPAFLMTHHY